MVRLYRDQIFEDSRQRQPEKEYEKRPDQEQEQRDGEAKATSCGRTSASDDLSNYRPADVR